MKNVVFNDTVREDEFKPDIILEKYLKLCELDARKEFKKHEMSTVSDCPACKSKKASFVFSKFGFKYKECDNCHSVFMDPRPTDEAIKQHYLKSSSAEFWRNTLSRKTKDKRKEKIYERRFQWVFDVISEYLYLPVKIADINSRNDDYTVEFLREKGLGDKVTINPYFDKKYLQKISPVNLVEELDDAYGKIGAFDVITAFEVVDFISDIESLLKFIKRALKDRGLVFVTTISISGFDLQVLWEKSKSIFPPDRINIFSKAGLEKLFKRHGFEIIEYSTPGLLDFDIVRNIVKKDKTIYPPRFIKTMLDSGDEQMYQDFQEFLQVNKLSSFVRMVLRKK